MILIENLKRSYKLGKENEVHALAGIDFEIQKGEMMALVGPSGSGKSTLLNILGGLDRGYSGEVIIEEKNLRSYNATEYRRNFVQTIFQQFFLVPSLSVWENMVLPVSFGNQFDKTSLKQRGEYILDKVGLTDRKEHTQKELSGGQIQRVAIARALITNPKIILADEPTGNLDSKTGKEIMDLLFEINKTEGTTVIIITHDLNLIEDVSHRVHLLDGKIEKEIK